jgi:hypothetical protein
LGARECPLFRGFSPLLLVKHVLRCDVRGAAVTRNTGMARGLHMGAAWRLRDMTYGGKQGGSP